MIHPSSQELLSSVAAALEETVLPELARGTAARRQLQAALAVMRRIAFALPGEAATLAADNADMAEVLRLAEKILAEQSPPPNLPHRGGGLGGGDAARNKELQQQLIDLQNLLTDLPPDLSNQITPLLIQHHKRMIDRALALIPPPTPRPPKAKP